MAGSIPVGDSCGEPAGAGGAGGGRGGAWMDGVVPVAVEAVPASVVAASYASLISVPESLGG
jgi:hypothetical protein